VDKVALTIVQHALISSELYFVQHLRPINENQDPLAESNPDNNPTLDKKLIDGNQAGQMLRETEQLTGDIILLKIENNAEPGARAFINVDNLIMKPIQVLRTIPAPTPGHNGIQGSFVSKLFDHYQIDSLGEYTTWMTQPQNSMRGEQLIVYLAETQNLNIAESIINLVAKL